MAWYVIEINPEPWAVGPLTIGRKAGSVFATMGRNQQLDAYKEAVRETLKNEYILPELITGPVALKFFFWRNRAVYTTDNQRKHRKHEADLTNLIKATEDALQDLLFANDRDTNHIEAWLVEQGADVVGRIIISCEPAEIMNPDIIPDYVWAFHDDSQLSLDETIYPLLDTGLVPPDEKKGDVPF